MAGHTISEAHKDLEHSEDRVSHPSFPPQTLWCLLPGLAAASMFCRASAPLLLGTPKVTVLHGLCPPANSTSDLILSSRALLCPLQASSHCTAAAPRSPQGSQHCSGLPEKTTQWPCGLNAGEVFAAHISSAKLPLISCAKLKSSQPMNEVLLLVYCCWCLGFPQLESL